MSPTDVRALAIVALVAISPLAIVLLAAIVRGYTIEIYLTRNGKRRRVGRNGEDE